MAKSGAGKLAAQFAKLVDVENALRITLTVLEPIPKEKQAKPAPESRKHPVYFTAHQITAPVMGLVVEALQMRHGSSKTMLSTADFITPEQFPHLPEELEIVNSEVLRHEWALPSAKIKLADGREFYVVENRREINAAIEKERERQRKLAVGVVMGELETVLGRVLSFE